MTSNKKPKKEKQPKLSVVFNFNLEDKELDMFMWNKKEKPPPLIKPKNKKTKH